MQQAPLGFGNYTAKAKDAIHRAHRIAIERDKMQVTPLHLLAALLSQENSLLLTILEYNKVDLAELSTDTEDSLGESTVGEILTPSYQIQLTDELVHILNSAEELAEVFKEKYVSVGILFIAMLDDPGNTKEIWQRFNITRQQVVETFTAIQKGDIKPDKLPRRNRAIEKYTTSLTTLASNGALDPVIGRDQEIDRAVQILSRRKKNNAIFIGEPGVGKTAIAEGLAQRIADNDVPESLRGKELVSLDMGLLIAGTKFRGEFEERLKLLMRELEQADGAILLFIDEMHTLIGAGSSNDALDASNLLKPALARGTMRVIGATTLSEYQKHIEKDAAFARRFQTVHVHEPTEADSITILRGLKEKYEVYHGVRITDAALDAAVKLSVRYITDRNLPDKAIDVLDEATARMKLILENKPEELAQMHRQARDLTIELGALTGDKKAGDKEASKRSRQIEKELADLQEKSSELNIAWETERELHTQIKEVKELIDQTKKDVHQAEQVGRLDIVGKIKYEYIPKQDELLEKSTQLLKKAQSNRAILKEEVTKEDIAHVVATSTGIPVAQLLEDDLVKLQRMDRELKKRIIGQDEAIQKVSDTVARARTGISDPDKPLGSFIFLGPTGVGKTELAKTLAEFLFDDEKALVRVDMSEYMEKHSVSKLIGSPPGYIGHEEGGSLTETVRHRPYSVLLFDEVEKAHQDIFNILLQVLDDGQLTDAKGRVVNFKNTIIIMTSNLGSEYAQSPGAIGFIDGDSEKEGEEGANTLMQKQVEDSLKNFFRPEFLNRIDETIIFNILDKKAIKEIVKLQMADVKSRLLARDISLQVSPQVLTKLATTGYDSQYGARPLKRLIETMVLNPLSRILISESVIGGATIKVATSKTDSFVFTITPKQNRGQYLLTNKAVKKTVTKKTFQRQVIDNVVVCLKN